ncbi:MAG: transposase [Verrucomicrobiales bacterium]|nr:transposase [Verrucomicrobiales bacterium]
MRKTREFLLGPEGQTNYYHVVSRTAGRAILFGDDEKEAFRILMLKQLKFSGLRALAWCFMGNHFHLLLEVPDKEQALRGWSRGDYLERLKMLKGEWSTKMAMAEVERCEEMAAESRLDEIAQGVRERLFDLSMFMKELKMKMTLAYNKKHGRDGALWQGRFKSVLLEPPSQGYGGQGGAGEGDDGSEALRTVAAYIDLNPIRAGLAQVPEGYRWCSYAAAVAGNRGARQALTFAVTGRQRVAWRKVEAEYRCLLYVKGEEVEADASVDGYVKGKGGFSQEEIAEVLESGGRLPVAVALRCRVRYFSDGAVLGSQRFVDDFFEGKRDDFGEKRKDGGRRMRGAQWGALRVLRDLKVEVIQ